MSLEMERNFYKNMCEMWDEQFSFFISLIEKNDVSNEVIARTMEITRQSLKSVRANEVTRDE